MSRRLEDLHPQVRPICLEHQGRASAAGLDTLLIETWRDPKQQAVEWAKGRNNAGEVIDAKAIVTNARPGQSWHNLSFPDGRPCSFAYHLAIIAPGGLLGFGASRMDAAAENEYVKLGEIGEALGLTWGGRWRMRDWTHFEWHPDGATLMQVIALLQMGHDPSGLPRGPVA